MEINFEDYNYIVIFPAPILDLLHVKSRKPWALVYVEYVNNKEYIDMTHSIMAPLQHPVRATV